jgi:hypothetical protein
MDSTAYICRDVQVAFVLMFHFGIHTRKKSYEWWLVGFSERKVCELKPSMRMIRNVRLTIFERGRLGYAFVTFIKSCVNGLKGQRVFSGVFRSCSFLSLKKIFFFGFNCKIS